MIRHNWKLSEEAELIKKSNQVFGRRLSPKWLQTPQPELQGRKPIDCTFAEVTTLLDQWVLTDDILKRLDFA